MFNALHAELWSLVENALGIVRIYSEGEAVICSSCLICFLALADVVGAPDDVTSEQLCHNTSLKIRSDFSLVKEISGCCYIQEI